MELLNIALGVLLAKVHPHKHLQAIDELLSKYIEVIEVKFITRSKIQSYHPNDFTAKVAYNTGTLQPDRISVIYKDENLIFTNSIKDPRLYRYSDPKRYYEGNFNSNDYIFTDNNYTITISRYQRRLLISINK